MTNVEDKQVGGTPPQQQDKQPGIESKMKPLPTQPREYVGSGKLKGRVAIITGGDSGIGRAVALAYAKEGANLVLNYLSEEHSDAEETKRLAEEAGAQVVLAPGDISEPGTSDMIVKTALDTFNQIDILVNNAGVGDHMQAAANVDDETWNRVMDINVTGVMRCIRRILPHFEENGGGTIINMASLAGLTGGRGGLTYTAAKHAVVGMTKNVASHYGPFNIRANAIAPGHVETGFSAKMTKLDSFGMKQATRGTNMITKAGKVSDIANIALFLASEQSSLINGVTITADGGWSAY